MKNLVTKITTRIAANLQRGRELRELERQLSHYRTPTERAELDAMIARSDADTTEIQQILVRLDRRTAVRDMYMTAGIR